jgi:uncharacterized protein YndB with AHSA1/START domain
VADGAGQDVVLERVFDAPVHLVWQLWTDPEHFRAWYGPEGEYREVVEHRRLVYTEAVSDERGGVPEEGVTEVRVELEDLGGRTRVVLTHVGVPGDSPGAAGWAMALEKLGARLSRTRS